MVARTDEDQPNAKGSVTRRTFIGGSTAVVAGAVVSSYAEKAFGELASSDAKIPALLRVSDAIKPGQLFSVNGEWLNASNVKVLVAAGGAESQPANGLTVPVVQTDEQGHFVVARLPQQLPPGLFQVWVRNAAGYSAPIVLNRPRPLFLSEFEAWAGQQLEIVGRNFAPDEYGAHGTPQVRMVNASGECHKATVVLSNPFAITITVPQVETTTYWVEVSTDGVTWWRVPGDERLKVVPVGKDPIGLGVAWADHFHWDRVFNVASRGVPTSGGVDVTAQVQAVVNAAKSAGGGVVYFPAGRYLLSGIALPAGVVLLGAGAQSTTLISTAVGGNFINTSGDGNTAGQHGVGRLRIELKDPDVRPDTFIWLGEPWAQNNNVADLTVRTASNIFVKDVDMNYSLLPPTVTSGQRGIGIVWIAKQRTLCNGCHFKGYRAMPYACLVTNYFTLKDNRFEYSAGAIVNAGSRNFYENNHIIGRREHAFPGDDLHGLFARDRTYMANNVVEGVGTMVCNDGESYCVEVPDANFNYGSVTSASGTTLTVAPQVPLTVPTVQFGTLCVVIVDGRGLGQLRKVTNIDSNTNKITVSEPWDVIPDSSSVFSLQLPLEQVTYYRNVATDCFKGMWFFGNTYDSVQADNTSTDSEGCFMWTVREEVGTFVSGYFARFARNTVTGISSKSQHGGISYDTARYDQNGAYFGTQAYGVEMVDNFISGDPNAVPVDGSTEAPPYPGLTCSGSTYSSQYDGNPVGGDGKNIVMLRNSLTKLTTGITMTHSIYGTVIAENKYTSAVGTFFTDTGSINTLLIDNKEA